MGETLPDKIMRILGEQKPSPPSHPVSEKPRIVTLDDIRDMDGNIEGHLILKKDSYDLDFRLFVTGELKGEPGTELTLHGDATIATYNGRLILDGTPSHPIVVRGEGLSHEWNAAFSFSGANATGSFSNVEFREFGAGPDYGVLYVMKRARVEMVHCIMTELAASGLYVNHGVLSAEECDFINCNPNLDSLFVLLSGEGADITLKKCTIRGHSSERAIIKADKGKFMVEGGDIEANEVYKGPFSVVEVDGAKTTLHGVQINGNTAAEYHILHLDGSIVDINDCVIFNNSPGEQGAVLDIGNSKTTIRGKTQIVSNLIKKGPSIGYSGQRPTIEDGVVIDGPIIESTNQYMESLSRGNAVMSNFCDTVESELAESRREVEESRREREEYRRERESRLKGK